MVKLLLLEEQMVGEDQFKRGSQEVLKMGGSHLYKEPTKDLVILKLLTIY